MKKNKPKPPAEKRTVHFVFIEEPLEKVAPELLRWDASDWWPKKAGISVHRQTPGDIQVGTVFSYKLAVPSVPAWTAEVTSFIPNRLMANTFKSRFLRGTETIRVEERANGTKVEYEIRYQIIGLLNMILWLLLADKAYSNSMKSILAVFKAYVLQKAKDDQEKNLEGKS